MHRKRRSPFRTGVPEAWLRRGMRLPFIMASILCSLAHAGSGMEMPAAKKAAGLRKPAVDIQVQGGGWGSARKEAIETVLNEVADELLANLPGRLAAPIVVTHTDGPPVALYGRGTQGEYRIHRHARGDNWHLYAYEFAHELCHVRSNYDENVAPGAAPSRSSQWFEETLCQTASLFTLKRPAQRWESTPPGPEWVGEVATLRSFFELLISEGHRQLPPNVPLYRNAPEEHRALVGDVLAMLKLGNDLRTAAVHLG